MIIKSKLKGFKYKLTLCFGLAVLIIIAGIPIFATDITVGDGGLIPFYEFSVYEPGQKAIIAWNGQEEIMILSVDVYGEESNKTLHMVPFPTLPEVELGNISAFEKVEELLWEKGYDYGNYDPNKNGPPSGEDDGIVIVFHEQIGPHDLTIIKVFNPYEFTTWVNNFLKSKGVQNISLPDDLDVIVTHYIHQNIKYFVFDVIEIEPEARSIDPIIYRFETSCLYFPLEISSIIEGNSKIILAFITPNDLPVNFEQMYILGFDKYTDIKVTHNELDEISSEIAELISRDACLAYYEGYFSLEELIGNVQLTKINEIKWMYTASGYNMKTEMYDINSDGNPEIISCAGNEIFAMDRKTGSLIWNFSYEYLRYSFSDFFIKNINFDNIQDVIFVYCYNEIFALNAKDGTKLWDFECTDSSRRSWYSLKTLKFHDINLDGILEIIFVYHDKIFVINAEDGSLLWEFTGTQDYLSDFIISNINNDTYFELIIVDQYYYDSNNIIYAFNVSDGNLIWQYSEMNEIYDMIASDIDSDGNEELIVCLHDTVITLNGENGTILWKFNAPFTCEHFRFPISYDINLDGEIEIIISKLNEIYAINGKDGSQVWKYSKGSDSNIQGKPIIKKLETNGKIIIITFIKHNKLHVIDGATGLKLWEFYTNDQKSIPIDPIFEDIDNDNKEEMLICTSTSIYCLNYEDGSLLWNCNVEYNTQGYYYYDSETYGVVVTDLDQNGIQEVVAKIGTNLYVINGENGRHCWNFTTGETLSYHTIDDVDTDGFNDILITTSYKIYSINYPNLELIVETYPEPIEAGETATVLTYVSNGSNGINGIDLKFTDYNMGGLFSEITDYGNGFYIFTYTALNTSGGDIPITIEAIHQTLGRGYKKVNITVIPNDYSEDIKEKFVPGKLYLELNAYPQLLKVGQNTTIVVYITNGTEPVSNVSFQLSDNDVGGTFSNVIEYQDGYYTFAYTAPKINLSSVTLLILAKHKNYYAELATVLLDIVPEEVEDYQSETSGKERLYLAVSAHPTSLKQGDTCTFVVYVNDGIKSISNVNLEVFDSGAGGIFSTIKDYNNGYYSFMYTVSEINLSKISILILASHSNYLNAYRIVDLLVLDSPSGQSNDTKEDELILTVNILPESNKPGETSTIIIYLTDNASMPVSNAIIQVTDNGRGGWFSAIEDLGNGWYEFDYTSPKKVSTSIIISLIVTHKDYKQIQRTEVELDIELDEEPYTDEEHIKTELSFNDIIIYSVIILIICAIAGLFAIFIILKARKKNKSNNSIEKNTHYPKINNKQK